MGASDRPTVSRLLRTYRSRARLTQEQLAARSGYSTDYIGKLERGERLPPSEALDLLATVLDLDASTRAEVHDARAAAVTRGSEGRRHGAVRTTSVSPTTTPMPVQVTSFIGREEELATVTAILSAPGARLLTLTGPGGIGKTRLAVRLGELLAPHFTDGTWFVPLAAVTDPQHVAPAIAAALGVVESRGVTLTDAIVRYLGEGDHLLVLDNLEHLQAGAPLIGVLVERCPGLRVVVASRAALCLASEQRYEVPPLAVPPDDHADVDTIAAHPAVRLFVDRARTARPEFRLDAATAPDVAAICAALDGLPLAIELAAARTRLFPPRALRQRLSSRLALLSGGPVDRPPRHQTLRATIDWSYDLLTLPERLLFARLGAFARGATIEAVEEVCDVDGDLDVVALLTFLVDKSLVQQGGEFEPRIRLLETIREYAVERLTVSGEEPGIRARHAAYYSAIVADLAPTLFGDQQDQAVRQLDTELDNVRAALTRLLDDGRVEEQLTMAVVFAWYQMARGSCTEAGRWLERGLSAGGTVSDAVRRQALLALGEVAIEQGHLDQADETLLEAQRRCEAQGDQAGVGTALNRRGVIACRQGDYDRAVAHAKEALRLATALDDRRGRASALVTLGTVATHRGEHDTARTCLTEGVELYRAIGGRTALAHALTNLGYDLTLQGRLSEATAIFEELVAAGQEFGLKRSVAYALENLGNISVLQGEYARAATRLREGLALGRELSDQHLLLYLFSDLVKLESARDGPKSPRVSAVSSWRSAPVSVCRWPRPRTPAGRKHSTSHVPPWVHHATTRPTPREQRCRWIMPSRTPFATPSPGSAAGITPARR